MLKQWLKTLSIDAEVLALGKQCRLLIQQYFRGSLAIRQVDAGSCNACELEIHALNNIIYNIEQFGIHFVASPRHADILLVTGPVSKHMAAALKTTYDATPFPKWVIAAGDCGIDGGEFKGAYNILGGADNVLPVDIKIAGCPPTPKNLLEGILTLLRKAPSSGRR